ncbi:zinc-binding dehydrogenase [Thermomicrobium sp. 4228-Ro]|uniref:zinc-binding dehydrogenase n=1 Tax=Thermomicrobium sp. 4228-Ro TaxID=2993937 RepID=UPI0022493305|nr:zinc-binding dehydrogenase [Thermomicrobium sp. 4228-Ro]MCX2726952.1 zinc-binding dehydrogenase [Thermomicrobium sp. 4228-Ro]
MRAARLHGYDTTLAGPEHLVLEDVPDPEIHEPDDVIVRIEGADVCRTDLRIVEGQFRIGYGGRLDVSTIELVDQEKAIVGNLVGTYAELVELMELVADGRIKLTVSYYPLAQIDQAFRDLRDGRIEGRAVIVP